MCSDTSLTTFFFTRRPGAPHAPGHQLVDMAKNAIFSIFFKSDKIVKKVFWGYLGVVLGQIDVSTTIFDNFMILGDMCAPRRVTMVLHLMKNSNISKK